MCSWPSLFQGYLDKAVSGYLHFIGGSSTWLCLCNTNVKKYIQSAFIPPTYESDLLILHILQFSGALQEFMIKNVRF